MIIVLGVVVYFVILRIVHSKRVKAQELFEERIKEIYGDTAIIEARIPPKCGVSNGVIKSTVKSCMQTDISTDNSRRTIDSYVNLSFSTMRLKKQNPSAPAMNNESIPIDSTAISSRYNDGDEPDDSGDKDGTHNCMLCLNPLDLDDLVPQIPCNHIFHKACLDRWLILMSQTCPACALPLAVSDDVQSAINHMSIVL
ncbi:putative E3 ubiquitin-protein ligase XERICO [Zancudomyces culisetae]|uniref:Putative E3 ubiquitin-protein ligase XERICO n=1 Tax=Zancudomyces culisetae TaxID=1213189 RepID=A0A1R1PST2_ZANCU|nr:putative E3 ubiquitin-protein ligase XERICO [Zancudomyces culisetae]|eukprot:OMH84055.1 putative E3 ubiquitin-protein ligase XERICO [Zancudomyces culisetae]